LLTEESWIEFKTLFSSAYPNFIENLFIQVGKLSHGELRLACMIRLNLTTNEMADMIGISQDSIKKGLLRFKNKLKFDTQADLLDFIYALPT
jgi:DNA-binding CsgD family transcriptional regulator